MNDQISEQSRFSRIATELRRRRILESAGLYIAGGWILIEGAATLFPVFGFPDWITRALVIAIVALFPVVMGLAWTFNITFKGLVRTEQLAQEVDIDLEQLPVRSVAIMPFTNLTGDAGNDYFADGMAEELLMLLAKSRDLKVAARTSSFALRGRETDMRRIGGLLGVRHVLEGSVRQAGDRIRITAQLIETPTGYHLWSETFDRDVHDVFAVQDEIAEAIATSLQLAIDQGAPRERTTAELPTKNIEAYQHLLRANYLWARRGTEAIQGAIGALEQAIAIDPGYAEAHARLAAARAILHEYADESREEAFALAEAHARQAIALDATLGEPHAVLGYMAMRIWRWRDAERRLQRAIELEPGLPTSHQWYSNLLSDLGRHDDAMREVKAAHELDPLSPQANNILALTAVWLDQEDLAMRHIAIAREYGIGGGVPDIVEFIVRLRRGQHEEAIPAWVEFQQRAGLGTDWVRPVVAALADRECMPEALAALATATDENKINSAQLFFHYLLLGQADLTFDVARTKQADHSLTHAWFMLREAEALRQHPRFRQLMESMGLISYWNEHGYPPNLAHLSG